MKRHIYIITLLYIINSLFISDILASNNERENKDVGEIPIHYSTTPIGGVAYTVPIESYSGVSGLNPNISLSYNSHGGNGIAGMGWNVSGMSTISAVNSSIYYDGETAPLSIDSEEFALDGVRLIKIGDEERSGGRIISYQTEKGNIKVEQYVNIPRSAYPFIVYYPNGSTVHYERANIVDCPNAKTNETNYQYCPDLLYIVSSIQNSLGYTMEYSYIYEENQCYISKVEYGGKMYNRGEERRDHFASIEFTYEDREDINTIYINGIATRQTKRLKSIETYYKEQKLRTYILSYFKEYDDGWEVIPPRIKRWKNSMLVQLDCSSGENSLPPLKFTYGENKAFKLESTEKTLRDYKEPQRSPDEPYNPVKVNIIPYKNSETGGRNGLVIYPQRNRYKWNGYAIVSPYDNVDSIYVYKDVTTDSKPEVLKIRGENYEQFRSLLVADINGVGKDNLIKICSKVGYKASEDEIVFRTYDGSILLDEFSIKTKGIFESPDAWNATNKIYFTGDFEGSGKTNVMFINYFKDVYGNPYGTLVTLVDLSKKEKIYEKYTDCFNINSEDYLFTLDFDGDGKVDICHINDKGLYVYSFDKNADQGIKQIAFEASITNKLNRTYSYYSDVNQRCNGRYNSCAIESPPREGIRDFLVGDINGDGKTDFIITPPIPQEGISNSSIWTILYSNGKDKFEKKELDIVAPGYGDTHYLQDINGDGLPDLVTYWVGSPVIYINNQGTFKANDHYVGVGNTLSPYGQFVTSEVLDNNSMYHMTFVKDDQVHIIKKNFSVSSRDMIAEVENSYGVKSSHEYKSLLDKDVHEVNNNNISNNPDYRRFVGELYVVSDTKFYTRDKQPENYVNHYQYKYTNATLHKTGLGFKGFEKTEIKDNILTFNNSINTYDPYNFSVLKEEDNGLFNKKYQYNINVANNKILTVNLTEKVEFDKLNKITSSQTYANYDKYGNVGKITTNYGNSGKQTIKTTIYQNTEDSKYLVGLPIQESVQTKIGNFSITNKVNIVYNSQYLPERKLSYYNNQQVLNEQFTYNSYGELTEQKSVAYSSPIWLTTTYEYDTEGRIVKTTDPMGFTTSNTYDTYYGRLKSITDHWGRKTDYYYNVWGQSSQTVYPTGTFENHSYGWASELGVNIPNVVYYSVNQTPTNPITWSYYDAWGRIIKTRSTQFDSSVLYEDYEYNQQGKLIKKSLPYKGNSASDWVVYNYDTYGRLIKTEYPSGKTDSYSYVPKEETSVIENIKTTKYFDDAGNVIKVTDPAGTITYDYRVDGQLNSITALGITTKFGYDSFGRQISMQDPSAGLQQTFYNNRGEVSGKIDSKGNESKFTYDDYGRLIRKDIGESIYATYTYNQDGLLAEKYSVDKKTETEFTEKQVTYTYDAYDRLSNCSEKLISNYTVNIGVNRATVNKKDVIDFSTRYAYLINGNVQAIEYYRDNNFIAKERYLYRNNHLFSITLNNNIPIWKLDKEDNMGLPSHATTGALKRTYEYDNYAIPRARTTVTTQGKYIQDEYYRFDYSSNNLVSRAFRQSAAEDEQFAYDNLNRLVGYGSTTVSYDSRGNIAENSAVGSYTYDISKPYAINSIYFNEDVNVYPYMPHQIEYNALNRPSEIRDTRLAKLVTGFNYDEDGNRIKMRQKSYYSTSNGITEYLTRYYFGDKYEADSGEHTIFDEKLYIGGDAYSAPAVYVNEGGEWQVLYICRDYLGSITHITDTEGILLQKLSYNAWGRLRDPNTLECYEPNTEPRLLLGRGYTGHEYLLAYSLINMNARLYDPYVGRFISPDPYVQDFWMSQNFNRYTYGLNNPLKYTDPNGEFWHVVIGAAVGGILNTTFNLGNINSWQEGVSFFVAGVVSGGLAAKFPGTLSLIGTGALLGGANTAIIQTQGFQNINNLNWEQIGYSAVLGGGTAALGAGAGEVMKPVLKWAYGSIASPVLRNVLNDVTSGAVTGFTVGATIAKVNGADWGDAASTGLRNAAVGAVLGAGTGAYKGHEEAKAKGISFWSGKSSSSIEAQKLANDLNIHSAQNGAAYNKEKVDYFYDQMVNGTFGKDHAASAYSHNGKIVIFDGNHRTAAALKYMSTHNNSIYLNQMLRNTQYTDYSSYTNKIYKFNIK